MKNGKEINPVEWNDNLRIGVVEIDRDHEWMVSNFNSVVNAFRTIDDPLVINGMFDHFVQVMASIFEKEEAEMVRAEFDDLDVHRERHKNYLSRLGDLREKVRTGINVVEPLISYFASWLNHHVSVTDRKFGEFLNRRGGLAG